MARSSKYADDYWRKLEKPRAFARHIGAGLGEYLARTLSHRAALAEPRDLAWLLASYARDGLGRVEADGRRGLARGGAFGFPPPSGTTGSAGYQVLKKWLSYREHAVHGRPLYPRKSSTLWMRRGAS